MSFITKFLVFGVLSAALAVYLCPCLIWESPAPTIPANGWWGRGKPPVDESKIPADNPKLVPFQVNVEESVILDLQKRLANTRYNEPLEGVQHEYGFNSKRLKEVVNYWTKTYNWKKQQTYLNQFSQFTTQIEGIDVHFLHVKPKVASPKVRVLPLMMVHGWPGSILEFYKILPLLTSPKGDVAFEVICPSIPGYGFSEAPHQPGFNVVSAARVFVKLMKRLGHDQFYVQGGDWGSVIGQSMALFYPESVRGLHLNMVSPSLKPFAVLKFALANCFPSLILASGEKTKMLPIGQYFLYVLRETAYLHFHATKPDTIGSALTDSPAGLAAYILEKFSTWTDRNNIKVADAGLTHKFSMDDLLTNVMIYWVTNSITSSARFYKENIGNPEIFKLDNIKFQSPVGVASFPNEIVDVPRSLVQNKYANLVTFNTMSRGGHFPAFEEPQLLADDFRNFVSKTEELENAKKVKPESK